MKLIHFLAIIPVGIALIFLHAGFKTDLHRLRQNEASLQLHREEIRIMNQQNEKLGIIVEHLKRQSQAL